jgi:hypothetical protein
VALPAGGCELITPAVPTPSLQDKPHACSVVSSRYTQAGRLEESWVQGASIPRSHSKTTLQQIPPKSMGLLHALQIGRGDSSTVWP